MVPDFVRKLEEKVKALEYELKNELPKEIQRARELGDLSENAEYHAAKERQDLVSSQLRTLKERLASVRMIDFSKIRRDAVGLGSTVKVFDTETEEESVYELVASEDADAANGKISTTSPIGRALINKVDGDVSEVITPGGRKELEILEFRTIHDKVAEAAD
ncbi:MAG: transcription elongation factor GreA [Acidobacteria bacterium]|nr:transcription elongation factor GreA [Acidobacteriota bacterium]